jgi:glyoxylase-like metal-dependent hydrolase (beta-lactamase superfamily II)
MTLDGTNTWLIAEPGSATAIVVDPGPDDEGHLRRVHGAATAAGQRISQIVLTHGHLDHSGGARRLAELAGAPVLALDPAQRLGDGGLAPGDVLTAADVERILWPIAPERNREEFARLLDLPANSDAWLRGWPHEGPTGESADDGKDQWRKTPAQCC